MPEPVNLSLVDPNAGYLDEITEDFERLQHQKAKRVESRVLTSLAFFYGEHHITSGPRTLMLPTGEENKLYLVFNLIAQRAKKFMGRVATGAAQGRFKAHPDQRDPKAWAEAEVVDRMIIALDQKVDQPSRTWEILFWLTYGGVAFEHVNWIPNATIEPMPQFSETGEVLFKDILSGDVLPESEVQAQVQSGRPKEHFELFEEVVPTGEVGSQIYGPLNVFVDASVRSVADLAADQAVYIAEAKTLGWVTENFGYNEDGSPKPEILEQLNKLDGDKDIKIITTQFKQLGPGHGATGLQDMIPMLQGTVEENDPTMFVVVWRYQPAGLQHPRGRFTVFIPGKLVLRDGENPYGEVPVVDYHLEPVTTTFWTKDYVTDLLPAQKFLNKRISQLGEQANGSIYDKVLLGSGIKRADYVADEPGVIENAVAENGAPLVQRLSGPQLPGWFLESINLVIKLLNDIAGGQDLFQESKFPGQLRGPMAVPMLQEILDSEWGNLYEHLGERFARAKQMRLNRVKQFYPPARTMHYTDRNQRDEVFVFHTKKILRAGTNYSIRVERGSMVPELRSLREARLMQRLQSPLGVLYMDKRTGRLDSSKIAADLQFGDLGREDREAQARKLAQEVIDRLWKGEQLPPVLPFWDHNAMMDELEATMTTTEFLQASPPIQEMFFARWREHQKFLAEAAERQQQFMQNQMVQSAVAQAVQQAAAQVAAETVDATIQQVLTQAQTAPQVPQEMARSLMEQQAKRGPQQ